LLFGLSRTGTSLIDAPLCQRLDLTDNFTRFRPDGPGRTLSSFHALGCGLAFLDQLDAKLLDAVVLLTKEAGELLKRLASVSNEIERRFANGRIALLQIVER